MTELTFNELPSAVTQLFDKVSNIERLLLEKKKEEPSDQDELLNVKQAAHFLSLSVPTIYGLTRNSLVPFSKKGKRLYFSKFDLINWVKAGRRKTIQEVANEAESYLLKKKGGKG